MKSYSAKITGQITVKMELHLYIHVLCHNNEKSKRLFFLASFWDLCFKLTLAPTCSDWLQVTCEKGKAGVSSTPN